MFGNASLFSQKNRAFTNLIFVTVYSVFLMLYEIAGLGEIVTISHPFFICWGIILVINNILKKDFFSNVKYNKLILIFVIFALLSSIINYNLGIINVTKSFIFTVLPLVIIYPFMFISKNKLKTLLISTSGIVLVTFICSLISNIMFIIDFKDTLEILGKTHEIGIVNYLNSDGSNSIVLFGIYTDSNHSSVYSMFSAILSIIAIASYYFNYICKYKKTILTISIANIITQSIYFPLANSRGLWLSFAVSSFVATFLFLLFRKYKKIKLNKVVISMFFAIVISITLYSSFMLIRNVSSSVYSNLHSSNEIQDVNQNLSFDKSDPITDNPRKGIWKEAINLFAKKPILGTTPIGVTHYAQEYDIGDYLENGKAVHNSYLDLLLSYGILGFAAYFIILLKTVFVIIKKYFILNNNKDKFIFSVAVLLFGIIIMTSSLLSCLFINTTAMQFMFLILLGFILSYENNQETKND